MGNLNSYNFMTTGKSLSADDDYVKLYKAPVLLLNGPQTLFCKLLFSPAAQDLEKCLKESRSGIYLKDIIYWCQGACDN